ncbi:transposon-encoded TnpW family protein [Dehalococcoides mccartyi]|uniref:Transposon-encoded TnpW family protein n=1 Tax=Dehalococcoides mccartyi TaxID=61435 RepID=A0AB38ZB52_9CHLR|nr:transposon-encoded TnpW family protein [Dehalococcoides mccartyi]WRO07767.1 transposon-encoded TnpW family protein [Dehalococcoides mccartyi]
MDEKLNSRITRKTIDGTVYVVESMVSDTARETVYDKLKRLVLTGAKSRENVSDSSDLYPQNHSTSSK